MRNSFLFGLSLMLMVIIVVAPFVGADPTKYSGYVARKTSGTPAKSLLLSRIGTFMPSPGQEQNLPQSPSFPQVACSFSSSFEVGGVATGPKGQFIERWDTGDLWFYNLTSKSCTLLHAPPTGGGCKPGSNCGYYGIASQGSGPRYLVALISFALEGLWTCNFYSVSHKCASVSTFIRLPGTFCASMPNGFCNPDGAAFDKSSNLWYADAVNGFEVELTASSHYASVGTVLNFGAPVIGVAIDQSSGNQWVVDYSCAGDVFENGALVSQAGDALESVALSNLNPSHTTHVYVGVTAECGNYAYAFVGDQNDFIILPTPFSSANDIPGISTQLCFSNFFGKIYLTKDTS